MRRAIPIGLALISLIPTALAVETEPDPLPLDAFLDNCPPENLTHKNDANNALRTKLFTAWIHAHRTGKNATLTGEWKSSGTGGRNEISASVTGRAVGFDWIANCTLPDAETSKALAINKDQRVTITGMIDSATYAIGNYGPELHVHIIHASIADTAPPPPALGPIAIRSASALQRITADLDPSPEKQKAEIDLMAASASMADKETDAYLAEHKITLDPAQADPARHAVPYPGMSEELLMLTGKIRQIRSQDNKTGSLATKEILFATYGYSDDAFIITIKGDSISTVKRVPPPDAKYYATPHDMPPPPPPPSKPKPVPPPKPKPKMPY